VGASRGPVLDAEMDSSSMNETILLLDDELLPRTFARDALQACGYTVLDSDEPHEALQIIRDRPVHLLVVDVVMPLMRGPVLADRTQASGRH
jgi:CheY-like chemotaxis protein